MENQTIVIDGKRYKIQPIEEPDTKEVTIVTEEPKETFGRVSKIKQTIGQKFSEWWQKRSTRKFSILSESEMDKEIEKIQNKILTELEFNNSTLAKQGRDLEINKNVVKDLNEEYCKRRDKLAEKLSVEEAGNIKRDMDEIKIRFQKNMEVVQTMENTYNELYRDTLNNLLPTNQKLQALYEDYENKRQIKESMYGKKDEGKLSQKIEQPVQEVETVVEPVAVEETIVEQPVIVEEPVEPEYVEEEMVEQPVEAVHATIVEEPVVEQPVVIEEPVIENVQEEVKNDSELEFMNYSNTDMGKELIDGMSQALNSIANHVQEYTRKAESFYKVQYNIQKEQYETEKNNLNLDREAKAQQITTLQTELNLEKQQRATAESKNTELEQENSALKDQIVNDYVPKTKYQELLENYNRLSKAMKVISNELSVNSLNLGEENTQEVSMEQGGMRR